MRAGAGPPCSAGSLTCEDGLVTAWMRRRPWLAAALFWVSGVVLVALIGVVSAHGGRKPVAWTEVVAVALIVPSIGSVGLAWGLRQRNQQSDGDHDF
jgi:predicted permease